tara:strand:+ start:889 stop:1620 length:732 start_codon:yes stop_codon:yes gene_type:complete
MTLSEYELKRQSNIDSNEAILKELGLLDAKDKMREAAVARPKKKKSTPRTSNNVYAEPRRSSRVEGKVVDYTGYEVDLDALDRQLKRKKRARNSAPPDRYEDSDYDKPRKIRKTNKPVSNFDIREQHSDLLSKLPVQPAALPSLAQLNSLRNYCMTKEHLEQASYPAESIAAYETLLVERPFFSTEQPCMFPLQSYPRMVAENRLMDSKPKVVCPFCFTDKSLIATLPARIQGGQIHGHMCGC